MTDRARPRRPFGLALIALVMVGTLTALGLWQLQRRDEKHALIAALETRLGESPVALPPPQQWSALTPAHDEFRRVRFAAAFAASPDAMVYSAGSAIRTDVSVPGTWAFLPARLASGATVIVNAGFVANTLQDRAQQDRAVQPLAGGALAEMTGYLRFPEAPGWLTPNPDLRKRLWFARDIAAMARALGWGGDTGGIAPFYIDLESPVPASGVPKPGPLAVHLTDNHMQYAITWFGLALVVAASFAAWLFGRQRA
jgi:cytochrome oxidase assembly protein ShyY1